MLITLFATTLALSGGQAVTVIATTPQPAEVRREGEADSRRVCRFETVTGSNRRTRVCRDVPRQGVQDSQTRDFMRESQRVRIPDAS